MPFYVLPEWNKTDFFFSNILEIAGSNKSLAFHFSTISSFCFRSVKPIFFLSSTVLNERQFSGNFFLTSFFNFALFTTFSFFIILAKTWRFSSKTSLLSLLRAFFYLIFAFFSQIFPVLSSFSPLFLNFELISFNLRFFFFLALLANFATKC